MRHEIPLKNWTRELADAIERSQDGDVIIVNDDAKRQMALSAKGRLCPQKRITVEVVETSW